MGNVLLIDFGSTYTKVAVADTGKAEILATASAHTTVDSGIMTGLNQALERLPVKRDYDLKLACSSAAGGLKMVAIGLVKDLTAEAARRAALGAGARVMEVFSYELAEQDLERLEALKPDIILLAGGTDGGNKDILLKNAGSLARLSFSRPVIVAGNKVVSREAARILRQTHEPVVVTGNVMPELNVLQVDEARQAIRDLFLKQIVKAKGLSLAEEFAGQLIMPTPAAVLKAAELLALGSGGEAGMGELLVIDIGGATTDVHSLAKGEPSKAGVNWKGLPEPFAKRSVEGDLGMRYSAPALAEAAGRRLSSFLAISEERIKQYTEMVCVNPDYLPESEEEAKIDIGLGRLAAELASERHSGSLEVFYTPFGAQYIQHGKDLTTIKTVIGTGGILVRNPAPLEILKGVACTAANPASLKPREPNFFLDTQYIMAAMGLLAEGHPTAALKIMKKYIRPIGGDR